MLVKVLYTYGNAAILLLLEVVTAEYVVKYCKCEKKW